MPPKMNPNKGNLNLCIQPYEGCEHTTAFFFEQLNDLKDINQYSEKEIIAIFKTKLQGRALEFYLDNIKGKNFTTLHQISQEYEKYFCKPHDKNAALRTLESLHIQENETFKVFAYRLKKIAKSAYMGLTEEALEAIQFPLFIKAVPERIKTKLLEEGISDMENAVIRAEQLHGIYSHESIESVPNSQANQGDLLLHINHNDGKKHTQKTFQHKDKNFSTKNKSNRYKFKPRQERYLQRKTHICAFCGKRGHLMKACYEFRNSQNLNTSDSYNAQSVRDKKPLNKN